MQKEENLFDVKFYISEKGRIGRGTYWKASLLLSVIWIIFLILIVNLSGYDNEWILGLVFPIFTLMFNVAYIIVTIKRLHDLDKSGWYYLIGLIPLVGNLILFIQLGFIRGTAGPNKYGDDPKQ